MKQISSSPYRPPAEPAQERLIHRSVAKKEAISATALIVSLLSLFGPMSVCVLAMARIIDVPWDSAFVPLATFFVGLTFSIIALIISFVARVRYRTWVSTIGIIVAFLAIPTTLAATWLLAMLGLANCPV